MEGLRYLCVAVLLLLFVSGVLSLLSRRTELRWIAAGIVLYCFYLFFVQRMNEDRYLAPMLPLVFAAGCAGWYNALRALFPTRGNGEPLR
jgi:membrane-bound acyltransferase YfiQ involved in biofilm formation